MNTSAERPLRVAFDHRVFVYQKHGGVSRYFCGLTEHLPDYGVEPRVISPFYVTDRLQQLDPTRVWGRHFEPTPRRQRLATIGGELAFRSLSSAFGADIVHETYYNPRRIAPRKAKVVLTVYDMIHEIFHELFPGDNTHLSKSLALKRADRIICISESTRRDLVTWFPEVEDRTSVTLLGFDPAFVSRDATPVRDRPYVLFVGARRDYKNFIGLAEAFAGSRLPAHGLELVAVGGGEWSDAERALLARLGIADRVARIDANDVMLGRLYHGAALFACPSLYEGFGIPPLEAMAAGCPVVAMRASSLPEVCGEAAEYAEPGNRDSLVCALEFVALGPARAAALRAKGHEQVKLFSWDRCARATADVYRTLM